MSKYYLLGADGEPVATDLMTWAKWFEDSPNRVLAKDELDGATVSTVFLGIDHSFGSGPPVLWETMIFGGPHDEFQNRYTSREDALEGHQRALRLASEGLKQA